MNNRRELVWRCLVATVLAAVVFVLCLYSASEMNPGILSPQQIETIHRLREINRAIYQYGVIFEDSARRAEDIRMVRPRLFEEDAEHILDAWGRPFRFEFDGTRLKATSYGRDGAPGGRGAAADIPGDEISVVDLNPSFSEYFFVKRLRPVRIIAFFAAGLTFLLALLTVRIPKLDLKRFVILSIWLAALTIGSVYVASVLIVILLLPDNH